MLRQHMRHIGVSACSGVAGSVHSVNIKYMPSSTNECAIQNKAVQGHLSAQFLYKSLTAVRRCWGAGKALRHIVAEMSLQTSI